MRLKIVMVPLQLLIGLFSFTLSLDYSVSLSHWIIQFHSLIGLFSFTLS